MKFLYYLPGTAWKNGKRALFGSPLRDVSKTQQKNSNSSVFAHPTVVQKTVFGPNIL